MMLKPYNSKKKLIKKLLLIFIYFLFTSCVTNYYSVNIGEDTPIYESNNENSKQVVVIPKGYSVYVSSSTKKYKRIKLNNYKGWAVNPVYCSQTNYNSSSSSSTNTSNSSSKPAKSTSTSSNYYNSSSKSSSGGTVHVKAYTRKDGTYVKAHTRSAPKRK
jgi:starvation-inducible outer membrane lipoprotein